MSNQQIASTFLGFVLLFFWYLTFQLSCISIIALLIIGGFMFKNMIELSITKKRCLANCYFKQNSFWYKFFTKKVTITIISLLNSIILTFILALNIIQFHLIDFLVLFLDIFLIIYLYHKLITNQSFNENIKEPIIKNSIAIINTIFIVFVFLLISFYQTVPDYINNDLLQTVKQASNQVSSNCIFINDLAKITNEIVAIKWWFMIYASINFNDKYYLKEIIWVIYLLGNYLMILAFSKYILEVLTFRRIDEAKFSN